MELKLICGEMTKHKLRTTFSLGLGLVKTKPDPEKSRTKLGRASEEDAIQTLRRDW